MWINNCVNVRGREIWWVGWECVGWKAGDAFGGIDLWGGWVRLWDVILRLVFVAVAGFNEFGDGLIVNMGIYVVGCR